jgi:hypothetical protein
LIFYGIGLFFTGIGLLYLTNPAYAVVTRIGAALTMLAGLAVLPVTRRIILNKVGISIGGILAITMLVAILFGWGTAVPPDADMKEIDNIQTDVSENQVRTQATFTDTHPELDNSPWITASNYFNISTTLIIRDGNQTIQEVTQPLEVSIEYNATRTVTVLDMYKTNTNKNQVTVELRNNDGDIIDETTINETHWSAIQDGNYSVTVRILDGENATYTPTNTSENTIRRTNIATYNWI